MTVCHATAALPRAASKILVWHQGALGDVLLAGPALQAVAAHYPGARMTLAGRPEPLELLRTALPVTEVWDSGRSLWLDLFGSGAELGSQLRRWLAPFDLAVIFTPRPDPEFLRRWQLAGVPEVFWLPSFPCQSGLPVGQVQAAHLRAGGLPTPFQPWRLAMPESEVEKAARKYNLQSRARTPRVILAPGSGHPRKNWPLAGYAELAGKLQESCRAEVWWLTGPAEGGLEVKIRTWFPDAAQRSLKNPPLPELAAVLSRFQLYVGNDSGVTHLAAAVQQPAVVAIFGPSDPVIWTPSGNRVRLVVSPQPCAPCTSGREIACPENTCLTSLPPGTVCSAINDLCPDWSVA